MDEKEFKDFGEPTWCYKVDFPHATFDIDETDGDESSSYCRGMVIDLNEVFQ